MGGLLLLLSPMLSLLMLSLLPASASADACPNAAMRFGPSANLPDCRAYELVTPRFKGDNSTLFSIHGFGDGNHVVYESFLPLPGAQSGQLQTALSSRTSAGWETTPLTVPAGSGEPFSLESELHLGNGFNLTGTVAFTGDFSSAFIDSQFQYGELDQNKQWNTFRVDTTSGSASIEGLPDSGPLTEELIAPPNLWQTTTNNAAEYVPGAFIAGNSADGSRVFFETTVKLPVAPGTVEDTHTMGNELYERNGGHTYLGGVLPDGGVPACGAEIGSGGGTSLSPSDNGWGIEAMGAASADGANVVFRTPSEWSCSEAPKTYLRLDNGQPDASTVELPGSYVARTADQQKLILAKEAHLYEYDIASGQAIMVGETPGYRAGFLGASDDGSRVYTFPGLEAGRDISLYEDGTFKALPIPAEGVPDSGELGNMAPANNMENRPTVSADGSRLVFLDSRNLTSYDSKGQPEVYMYNADNGSLLCLSCNPDGASPLRGSGLTTVTTFQGEDTKNIIQDPLIPKAIPAVSSDDAHVFFDSEEGLVPQDTNGLEDVYEWEREGTGTCGTANTNYSQVSGGCVYLISSGTGSNGSWITGVSEDGNNVFFVSNDSLAPQVAEASQQIYDARVDGGFQYTPPTYGCDSGQCQGPQTPAPPLLAPPPSATFVGLGNPTPEAAANVKPKHQPKVSPRRRLAQALKACRRVKGRRRRAVCDRKARHIYGVHRRSGGRDGHKGGTK